MITYLFMIKYLVYIKHAVDVISLLVIIKGWNFPHPHSVLVWKSWYKKN